MKKRIAITADCVCDFPNEMLEDYDVHLIHFYILVDTGCFKDMEEITADNMVEYFENGGQEISTKAPKKIEFEETFGRILKDSDEIIHFSMTSKMSLSTQFAIEAAEMYEGKVHVIDTGHLSTGMSFMMIKAKEMIAEGKTVEEILKEMEAMKSKICTTFITENVNCLYRNGRVSEFIKNVCNLLKIHPVLTLSNGLLKMKYVQIGSYERSAMRYIRKELKNNANIDKKRVFITKCSCPLKLINMVKDEVMERCNFEEMIVTEASATISSNCGKNTFGVLFVRE